MNKPAESSAFAIACGGTGGHLFPGLAVAEVLQECGCEVALLVSRKQVDQEAIRSAVGLTAVSLPAIGLQDGQWISFARGCIRAYQMCRENFRVMRPRGVLAMGGFTSVPAILAAKSEGCLTFLHESNSVPGRANRWLSPWVDEIFVGFPTAAQRLYHQSIRQSGTPVRPQFKRAEVEACRMALGLRPDQPVLVVTGGSQGATGLNTLVLSALPLLQSQTPGLQFIHLTGNDDFPRVQAAYGPYGRRAIVRPFLTEMDLALGAATIVVSRAGASSLAELAAMRIPALLVPYPYAADNHQFHNARALAATGAALMIEQKQATASSFAGTAGELLANPAARGAMQHALTRWHFPNAAAEIAHRILGRAGRPKPEVVSEDGEFRAFELPERARAQWRGQSVGAHAVPGQC